MFTLTSKIVTHTKIPIIPIKKSGLFWIPRNPNNDVGSVDFFEELKIGPLVQLEPEDQPLLSSCYPTLDLGRDLDLDVCHKRLYRLYHYNSGKAVYLL